MPFSLFSKVTHLFDNGGTVFFAIFMAIWGKYSSLLLDKMERGYIQWCFTFRITFKRGEMLKFF